MQTGSQSIQLAIPHSRTTSGLQAVFKFQELLAITSCYELKSCIYEEYFIHSILKIKMTA